MTSFRKKVSSYIRQLSFHNEPRRNRDSNAVNDNCIVTKYLSGDIMRSYAHEAPMILYGKEPNELPLYELDAFATGTDNILSAYTGPCDGLTSVNRSQKHLTIADPEIDFIDTHDEREKDSLSCKSTDTQSDKSPKRIDNTTMRIKVGGREFNVTTRAAKKYNANKRLSHSLDCLNDLDEILTVKYEPNTSQTRETNNNLVSNEFKCLEQKFGELDKKLDNLDVKLTKLDESINSCESSYTSQARDVDCNGDGDANDLNRSGLVSLRKSKSAGDPFKHGHDKSSRRIGKLIVCGSLDERHDPSDEPKQPPAGVSNWKNPSKFAYGVSDTLYEKNPITNKHNGEPIADCFGILAREDSAILALADGVNWGQKASIAAKSAVHGSIHYLNDTLFNTIKVNPSQNPTNNINANIDVTDQKIITTNSNGKQRPVKPARKSRQKLETTIDLAKTGNRKPATNYTANSSSNANAIRRQKSALVQNKHVKCTQNVKFADEVPVRSSVNDLLVNANCQMNDGPHSRVVNTEEVFVSLLRAFYVAHNLILENEGMLTTLTVAVVLPLKPKIESNRLSSTSSIYSDTSDLQSLFLSQHLQQSTNTTNVNDLNSNAIRSGNEARKFVCCVCNLGDSLAYVYSKKHGVRELTRGSHDINSMRDVRDALGALGPVDGTNPELNNLTLSMSIVDAGDIIFLTSDGISDNFDPVIGRFAVLPSVAQASNVTHAQQYSPSKSSTTTAKIAGHSPRNDERRPRFQRSTTSLGSSRSSHHNAQGSMRQKRMEIPRSPEGVPIVTANQRYELTLLRMEDLLNKGVSGQEDACRSAQQLCTLLLDFCMRITAGKRHMLEDTDLYYQRSNNVLVELNAREQKSQRRKCLDRNAHAPGKLDHATVVAFMVGSNDGKLLETNF